ncbi:MAG TPA: 1,4-alpha-glucan branching protein domain-containing protein, partial [Actinomycetales bacterium]|nr:1,4-alpha-glucan branching protein domain-containing protein [Actinomycetales bacterium]
WAGAPVREMADEAFWVQRRLLDVLAAERTEAAPPGRRPELDQLLRQALLTLSSDWAFMVTRDSAADYASRRDRGHRAAFHTLAALVAAGRRDAALAEAAAQRADDGPFGWLDARAVLTQ